jgi:ABC-2 type transport system permease protein
VLVFGIAFLIGFRSDADLWGWVAAAGVLLMFIVAISWLAALVGVLARSPEAANGFTFFLMFLPYASSAFVPIDTMPSWLQGFSAHQPVTPIIESVRGLLAGTPIGNSGWIAIAWCASILAVSVLLSAVAFRRRTR